MLCLELLRCSVFTGITFAFPRRFRELPEVEVGLLCLALIGGRWVAIQEGSARDPDDGA